MNGQSVREPTPLAGGSAVVATLTTAVYVAVIRQQGDDPLGEVLPWIAVMLLGACLALAAACAPSLNVGRFAAVGAAIVLGLLGFIALFSVGIGFMLGALMALLAATIPSQAARADS